MPPRIDSLLPSALSTAQAELYALIAGGARAQGPQHFALTRPDGALRGPFNALLLSPVVGEAVQGLGAAIRFSTSLSPRVREIAILQVAARWRSTFEQHAHESVGRSVGLTAAEIEGLRLGKVALDDPVEQQCARIVAALLDGDVDDALWEQSVEHVAPAVIFELTTLVGYYSMLALQLRVFRADEA